MKLKSVDPRKIRIPEVRVTARMDEEKTELFRESVKTIGIDEPLKVYEVEGELWLSDGLHRLQEAIRLNLPRVDVTVREGTMIDVLCNNLVSGHLRGKHPPGEMLRSIEELWKNHGMSSEDIAAKTGLPRDRVEDFQLIAGLSPMCRAALDEERIGVGMALQLARLKEPGAQELYLNQALLYGWKIATLKEYIDAALAQPGPSDQLVTQPAPRAPSKPVCYFCHEEHDLSEVASPIICNICSGILLQAIGEAARMAQEEAAEHKRELEAAGKEGQSPGPG